MLTALTFLAILIVLVIIHELGHFIAAKKNGVLVEEFGFGFPPRLFGIKYGETLYSVNLIPLGGFVKLYGEEYHEEDKHSQKGSPIPKKRAFVNKTPLQKTIIITAGVVMNFFLGWVIMSFLFTQGVPQPAGVSISSIQADSPASLVGLQKGDQIEKITYQNDTIPVVSSDDLIQATKKYADEMITLTISRDSKQIQVDLTPRSRPPQGQGALGVVIEQQIDTVTYPWYQAPYFALIESVQMVKNISLEILKIPGQLITQRQTDVEFAGPVGIAKVVGEARKFGLNALLQITAILSLNLAVINILPFPALDGGRQVFILYEWVTGKKSNKKLEQYLNFIGIVILLSLSVVITFFDIQKYWG